MQFLAESILLAVIGVIGVIGGVVGVLGEGGIRPLLVEDTLAQACEGGQGWAEGHVLAVEEQAAKAQQPSEVVVEARQRFGIQPMERGGTEPPRPPAFRPAWRPHRQTGRPAR